MKKLLLLLALSAIGLTCAYSQPPAKDQSAVLIEDGSQILGYVTYDENTVIVETAYGEVIRVPLRRVVRITEFRPGSTANPNYNYQDWGLIHRQGLYTNFSYGFFFGSYESSGGTSLSMEIGYRFRPEFSVGGSVGWTLYGGGPEFTLPLKAVLRSEFGTGKVAPLLILGLGYNIPLDNGQYRGFIATPEVGIAIRGARRVNHSLTLVFNGSQFDADRYLNGGWWGYESDKNFHWGFGLKYSVGI